MKRITAFHCGLVIFSLYVLVPTLGAADDILIEDFEGTFSEQRRELKLVQRYLNLPVKNGAAKRRMSLTVQGEKVREFEIEAADRAPDFWVFLDLEPFLGLDATLSVDRLPEDSLALRAVELSDQIKGGEDLYREKYRPQFHFTSRRGWNNDPNGLVYYGGEYHLFYQHNPYGREWGNMHWGHAISRDLVHWTELPIALYPRRFGDWAFSGSAWVDWPNSGGFKTGEADVLVAAYTSTGRGECIVHSNDRGRTWTEYSGNRGRVYLPMAVLPEDQHRSLELTTDQAPIVLETLAVHELKSAWSSP